MIHSVREKRRFSPVVSRQRSLGRAVRTEKFTYIEWPDGSPQLYDHKHDPKEYINLSEDPGYAQTFARVESIAEATALVGASPR